MGFGFLGPPMSQPAPKEPLQQRTTNPWTPHLKLTMECLGGKNQRFPMIWCGADFSPLRLAAAGLWLGYKRGKSWEKLLVCCRLRLLSIRWAQASCRLVWVGVINIFFMWSRYTGSAEWVRFVCEGEGDRRWPWEIMWWTECKCQQWTWKFWMKIFRFLWCNKHHVYMKMVFMAV